LDRKMMKSGIDCFCFGAGKEEEMALKELCGSLSLSGSKIPAFQPTPAAVRRK
jgi:hypothetical protein